MFNNSIKKFFKATLLFTVLLTIFACSNAVNGTNEAFKLVIVWPNFFAILYPSPVEPVPWITFPTCC